MLGHSSAGKTTYMAALYHIMSNGLYDYTLRYDRWTNYWYKHFIKNNMFYTVDESEQEGKDLEMISQNVSKGIYPPATAIRQEYIFKMRYKYYNEIEFNWFDYRGGALMERSSQSSDAAELISKIKESDALIVFLDGTKLEQSMSQNEREYRRLVYLVKSAISSISVENDAYYPISFVITKEDLCSDVLDSKGFEYFANNILSDIGQSDKVAGLITCITVNQEHIFNVHFPLFFSIYHCLHKFAEEVVASYKNRDENRGFIDTVKEFFTDKDKNATIEAIKQLEKSHENLHEILNERNNKSLFLI